MYICAARSAIRRMKPSTAPVPNRNRAHNSTDRREWQYTFCGQRPHRTNILLSPLGSGCCYRKRTGGNALDARAHAQLANVTKYVYGIWTRVVRVRAHLTPEGAICTRDICGLWVCCGSGTAINYRDAASGRPHSAHTQIRGIGVAVCYCTILHNTVGKRNADNAPHTHTHTQSGVETTSTL